MNEIILKIENISKAYKNKNVLSNINMELEKGKIYGLLGPNGAGKTTLMRIIGGLSTPSEGKIVLFGHSDEKSIAEQRKRVGFMIENPSLCKDMNALENMKLHRTMRGIPNSELDKELLKLVGFNYEENKNKLVKNFSVGMKQKLGIAIALLGNPELLILDEPINGVDPKGIIEIRKLLRKLCEEKKITILLSSHILSELHNLASEFIILNQGKIIEETTGDEISKRCSKYIHLETNEPERMAYILETSLNTKNYRVMNDKSIRLYDYTDDRLKLAQTFLENKILVTNLSCEGDSLEDYYMSVLGGKNV